jgi:hypothetical protein
MYSALLVLHSLFRWLVLFSLLYSIYRAYRGLSRKTAFTKTDDRWRHWTATIAHLQLVIGFTIYLKSPVVKFFFSNFRQASGHLETLFFGAIHILFMLAAIIIITIGSALAKRRQSDPEKFKTMGLWFALAFIIIFLAIPWPFSPLANRPYFKNF